MKMDTSDKHRLIIFLLLIVLAFSISYSIYTTYIVNNYVDYIESERSEEMGFSLCGVDVFTIANTRTIPVIGQKWNYNSYNDYYGKEYCCVNSMDGEKFCVENMHNYSSSHPIDRIHEEKEDAYRCCE